MTFTKLGLSDPLLQALNEKGYKAPTAIQEQAIPLVLAGKNLVASAQTGTGKTASFVLPLLQGLSGRQNRRAKRIRALILVPTRELAEQVGTNIDEYGKYMDIRSMVMVGGVDEEPQKRNLIEGVDILVATPGRLLDMAHQRAVYFDELQVLVLDEADRMLDMGFIEDINKIIQRLPEERQSLLFSATLSNDVRLLAKTAIDDPQEIAIAADKSTTPQINQWLVTVDKDKKSALLSHLIKDLNWAQALIFIRTKHGAAKLVSQLEKRGIKAEAIHSGRSQASRTQLLNEFKAGAIQFLVATGIAARGIDIDNLERVINYDLPDDADDYIHRIGRTGRAGATGEAVSLVSLDDFKRLCAIESRQNQIIRRVDIEGFTVAKTVPVSTLKPFKRAEKKASTGNADGATTNKKNTKSKNSRRSTGKQNHPKAKVSEKEVRSKPAKSAAKKSSDNLMSAAPKTFNPWLKK